MPPPDDVRFRVLGPLTVIRRDRIVAVSAARHRAVLAVLLLAANRYVTRDLLIDQVWNGAPPEAAVKTVQSYVSRLRSLLAGTGARIDAGHGGRAYRLAVAPDAVDAAAFEELIRQGRAALDGGLTEKATAAFRDALALWQERPLADLVAEYRFADEAAQRLAGLRTTAVEGLARAAAEPEDLAALADDLAEAARARPERGALHELLLRALVAAGRQTDALAAFTRYRRLRQDQGLDPEPAIADLHRRILRQDPVLVPGSHPGPELVGRTRQLSRLREALAAADAGRGRCVLLDGEAGVGKTTLAARLVDEALDGGVLVAAGSPHDTAGPPAFRPWLQVLRALVTAGVAHPALTHAQAMLHGGAGDAVREQQFDAVLAALRVTAALRPLLVLLDDMHEADEGSTKLLLDVARQLPGSRVLLIVVAREPPDDPTTGWAGSVERLRRTPGVWTLRLDPLGGHEVAQLVAFQLGHQADPDLLAAVTRRSGGNPLFAVELTRLLADERALGRLRRTGQLPEVPPLVRDTVRSRARLLPPRCQELVSFAAVLGLEFELAVLRADETLAPGLDDHIDDAIAYRLVEPARPGVLRFCHPLMHEALYQDIAHQRREDLHTRAAAALERAYGDRVEIQAERLAHHWRQVSGPAARRRAYTHAMRASEQATAMLAWEEAARLAQLALDLDDRADAAHTAGQLLRLGRLLVRAGDVNEAGRRLLEAVALAPPDRSPDLFVEIVLAIVEDATYLATRPQHTDEAVRLLGEALELTSAADSPLRARLLAGLGWAMAWATDGHTADNRARRDAYTQEAVEVGRRLGARDVVGRAMYARLHAIWRPDNPGERYALCTEMLALAQERGDVDAVRENLRARFVAGLELGQAAQATADARAYALAAARHRSVGSLFWVNILDTSMHMMTGDFAAAEAAMGRLVAYSAGMEDQQGVEIATGLAAQTLLYHRERGRLPAPVGVDVAGLEQSLWSHQDTNPQLSQTWRVGAASFLLTLGRHGEAREIFDEVRAVGFDAIQFGPQWMCTVALAAELCVHFDDADTADQLKAMLTPYTEQCAVVTFGFGCLGSVAHFAAQLAGQLGDGKEAEDLFETALRANRRLGARPLVARTRFEYARALLRAGAPADRHRALRMLAATKPIADRLGMGPLARDIDLLAATA